MFVLSCFFGSWGYHLLSKLKQHENTVNASTIRHVARAYLEKEGRAASTLPELIDTGYLPEHWANSDLAVTDAYGNPYVYQSRNDAFVLVSYGRGGEAELMDYWAIREEPVDIELGGPICGDYRADLVLSDRGIHRGCFIK